MKKRICIITFSNISRDGRVLRQIQYLSDIYDVSVIGYGPDISPQFKDKNIKFFPIPEYSPSRTKRVQNFAYLLLGRLSNSLYTPWFWDRQNRLAALKIAKQTHCDLYHANDWDALPIAAEAAQLNRARLFVDFHEYSPLEYEERWYWRFVKPAIEYWIRRYSPAIQASSTVAPAIAERYHAEFGLDPAVIYNAPARRVDLLPPHRDGEFIELIHHGSFNASRRPELLLQTLVNCDHRFRLNLMMIGRESLEVRQFENQARHDFAERVRFIDPVQPDQVVERIKGFDLGLSLVYPTNYNNLVCLPNKFWDFIAAGLSICTGPSPSMAKIVNDFQIGCVSRSFDPADIAAALNSLDRSQIQVMRQAAQHLSAQINADTEMQKLNDIYASLLGDQ